MTVALYQCLKQAVDKHIKYNKLVKNLMVLLEEMQNTILERLTEIKIIIL